MIQRGLELVGMSTERPQNERRKVPWWMGPRQITWHKTGTSPETTSLQKSLSSSEEKFQSVYTSSYQKMEAAIEVCAKSLEISKNGRQMMTSKKRNSYALWYKLIIPAFGGWGGESQVSQVSIERPYFLILKDNKGKPNARNVLWTPSEDDTFPAEWLVGHVPYHNRRGSNHLLSCPPEFFPLLINTVSLEAISPFRFTPGKNKAGSICD